MGLLPMSTLSEMEDQDDLSNVISSMAKIHNIKFHKVSTIVSDSSYKISKLWKFHDYILMTVSKFVKLMKSLSHK